MNILYTDWFWAALMISSFTLLIGAIIVDFARMWLQGHAGWRRRYNRPMARRVGRDKKRAVL
jgi:hypothetical protein